MQIEKIQVWKTSNGCLESDFKRACAHELVYTIEKSKDSYNNILHLNFSAALEILDCFLEVKEILEAYKAYVEEQRQVKEGVFTEGDELRL